MAPKKEHLKLWTILLTEKQIGCVIDALRERHAALTMIDNRSKSYYSRLIKTLERQAARLKERSGDDKADVARALSETGPRSR